MSRPDGQSGGRPRGDLLPFLQLLRLPNLFTAPADVLAGYVIGGAAPPEAPTPVLALAVSASITLYAAGVVWNDVLDVEVDRRERPQRPLPAGRVSLGTARAVGIGLVLAAAALLAIAGFVAPSPMLPGTGAVLLLAILAYDGGLKNRWFGPLVMGSCRGLNVLLGVAAGLAASPVPHQGLQSHHGIVAGGVALYITGITWLARREAGQPQRGALLGAIATMLAGIGLLGTLVHALPPERPRYLSAPGPWWLLMGLLALLAVRPALWAAWSLKPPAVQHAVKVGIWSLILLDAAVAALVAPIGWSIAIAALLLPTTLAGRWIYST